MPTRPTCGARSPGGRRETDPSMSAAPRLRFSIITPSYNQVALPFTSHRARRGHPSDNFWTENSVSQMPACWRRRVHDEIGSLDPALDLAFDYALFRRLAGRGAPIYLDDEIACFRMYGSSKS